MLNLEEEEGNKNIIARKQGKAEKNKNDYCMGNNGGGIWIADFFDTIV